MIDPALPIAVLGAGSWGTSLAVHLALSGRDVLLWGRSPEFAAQLEQARENVQYLPGVALPKRLSVTSTMADLSAAQMVVMVVPSHGFRAVLRQYLKTCEPHRGNTDADRVIVSATKGIETETQARMSQVCFEEGLAVERDLGFAVLSGPTFAAELTAADAAASSPTACVVAADDLELAMVVRDTFSSRNFRLYSSTDVVGVEIGGTGKNVVAIAAGAVSGLGFGHNTLAALMTRGLHEITRLGMAYGGKQRTFAGLAGMGDLVLTCTGGLSRNRRTGVELAKGRTLEEIREETQMVSEGVRNCLSLQAMAQARKVEMPITEQMVQVLYENKSPKLAVEQLMTRDLKSESEL